MSTRESSQERARRLKVLCDESPSAAGIKEILHALGLKNSHVVAAAAEVAGAWHEASCVEGLVAAFEVFMTNPVKRDSGCTAKVAIVRALHELERGEFDLYLRAARHVQMEPAWSPDGWEPEETAADLRVAGASALVELRYPDADFVLVDLTLDQNPTARQGAIHILGRMGGRQAQVSFRTKARGGDSDPGIVGAALEGLMKIDAEGSLDFVAEFLESDDPVVVEQAALAIGEARMSESFARLRDAWEGFVRDGDRELLLLGMALTRSEESIDFLVDRVRDARVAMAVATIEALGFYRSDTAVASRVIEAAGSRREKEIARALALQFGSD